MQESALVVVVVGRAEPGARPSWWRNRIAPAFPDLSASPSPPGHFHSSLGLVRYLFYWPLVGYHKQAPKSKVWILFYLTILPDVSCGLTDVPFTRKLHSWDFECYGHCCYRQWFCQGRIWKTTCTSVLGWRCVFPQNRNACLHNLHLSSLLMALISGLWRLHQVDQFIPMTSLCLSGRYFLKAAGLRSSRFCLQNSLGSKRTQVVGRWKFKLGWKSDWCSASLASLMLGYGWESCRLGPFLHPPKAFRGEPRMAVVPLGPRACSQHFSAAWVLTAKSLSPGFCCGGEAEGSCFLQNTSEAAIVAAAEDRWGFLTFLLQGAGCKGAVEWGMHCSGRAGSLLQQPSSPVFCLALF